MLSILQTTLLQAAATPNLISTMGPIVLMFVIFYFLLIRPQQKKQKELKKMLEALKKGDKIVTIGGIKGVIAEAKKDTVIIKVDDNTKMEFLRSAISEVLNKEEKESKNEKESKDTKETKESDDENL